jgi:hypothetical protein
VLLTNRRREIMPGQHRGSNLFVWGTSNMSALAARSRFNRSQITNRPLRLRGLDGRSGSGRRRRDLIEAFADALGGSQALSEVQMIDVRRAAELVAVTEEVRAAALKQGGAAVDLHELIKLEGAADRAVRRLCLKAEGKPAAPSLAEHLAKRAAERAGARSGEPAEPA